jgi:hypothetical protein
MSDVDVASRTPNNLLPALRAAVADGNTIESDRNAGSWSCSTASEGGSRDAQSDGSGSVLAQRRSAPAARSNRTSRRGSTASVSSGPARRHLLALRVGGMPDDMILELTNLGSADLASLSSFKRTETTNGIAKAILAVTFHPSHGRVMTLGIGPQRRIRALVAMGYSVRALCELTGLTAHKLSTLPSDQLVPTAVWRVINDVYEHLSMTPGPDEQGRDAAREQGWATPLAWDDDEIDNPRARPHSPRGILGVDDAAVYRRLCGDRTPSLTLAEQEVIVGIAVQRRWSGERLGDVLGIEPGSATRKVDRYRLRMTALGARSQNERESNVA